MSDTPSMPWPAPTPSALTTHATMSSFGHHCEPLSAHQGECLVRLVEASRGVVRRHQFFGWTQNHLHGLLPHIALVCGSWQRGRRSLGFDVFHSVMISPTSLHALTTPDEPLLAALAGAWVVGQGQPLLLSLQHFLGASAPAAQQLRTELGNIHLLVHGVGRPMRHQELETLFVLIPPPNVTAGMQTLRLLDLVLPYLHSTWLQVRATESEMKISPGSSPGLSAKRVSPTQPLDARLKLTAREREILGWVREGKSNHEVGEVLGISPLTVKNHLQKILRKLGASNRAQAVAMAMKSKLLDSTD